MHFLHQHQAFLDHQHLFQHWYDQRLAFLPRVDWLLDQAVDRHMCYRDIVAKQWLIDETAVTESAAEQMVTYAAAQQAAIGFLPTQRNVVFERFFDESGGMQLLLVAGARCASSRRRRRKPCSAGDGDRSLRRSGDGCR